MPAGLLHRLLAHPLTASLDLDDPATTELRKQIICSKPFLKAIYDEWYQILAAALPPVEGQVLELGSGAGYCARFIPDLVTSEIAPCNGVRIALDARRLPFADQSLRAILMTNVLHHISDVNCFFADASRCLRPGGKILIIEPWITPWSRFVYCNFHNEPLRTDAADWSFAPAGPLSGANIAIPWIVFARDHDKFASRFPSLHIECIRPFLPFRYLVSGGVAMRSLMPGFTHRAWAWLEHRLQSQMPRLGLFAFISVRCD